MKSVASMNGLPPTADQPTHKNAPLGSDEEWDRLSPWWPHVRRLPGLYFWAALGVLVGLGLIAGYCTWVNVQPTTVAGEIVVVLAILILWAAELIAFTGWVLRRESRLSNAGRKR